MPGPGPFDVVGLDDGVSLAFMAASGAIQAQHDAVLVTEAKFDAVMDRIRERGLEFWADPRHRRPGQVDRSDGGRGVYFEDPDGHNLAVITCPYGG